MAARFFVNGAGDFSWNNPANWALTSGGSGGEPVPTSADDVTLDLNSPTCYLTSASDCKTLTITSGFVNIFGGFATTTQNLTVAGTTGTVLAVTPGAGVNSSVSYVTFYVDPATGSSVNVNINLGNTVALISTTFVFTLNNAATVTLLTNGNFARTASLDEWASILVYAGTFSTGAVNPTFGNLTCYGGTCNFNASVVTMATGTNFGANFTFSAQAAPVTVALGTSVINGAGTATFQEPSVNMEYVSFPITITVGATQTLNVRNVSVKPSVSTTLRTITARRVSFIQPSGANITAGVVTANEYLTAAAVAGYTTLPTLTLTSITGTNSLTTDLYVNISEVGFTCGAISLTYSTGSSGNLYYTETSKGQVNVTGAITLTDNGLFTTPGISINSQAAFSGSPTITYTGLNASVRGTISVAPPTGRSASLGAITAGTFYDYSNGGDVTTTTITLGGTLSAVVYNGEFGVSPSAFHAFQSTTIGPGTGALVYFNVVTTGSFTATAVTAHTRFSLNSSNTVSLSSVTVTANSSFDGNFFISGNSVTITGGITFSGSVLTTDNFIEIGSAPNPVGPLSIGGAVTTGSSATNRLALIIRSASASVAFVNASITHSMSQLIVYDNTTLTWGATQVLNLNQNAALLFPTGVTNPLSIISTNASTIGLPATLTSTYSDISKKFYISTPNAAVTFSATAATLGSAAGSRGIVDVTAASYSCGIALDTSGFSVVASGAITQSGIVTISSTSVTSPSTAIYVSAGATSTFQGLNAATITDTTTEYLFSFLGSGALTIASTITGPTATNVSSRLVINRSAATTFSGAISAINTLDHTNGNLVFTGALAIGVRRYIIFSSGYTLTPNTSVITISGTSTVPNENGLAILDHGGYTLNSIVFSATASKQYIRNTTSAAQLTTTSLTSTGAAVPYSFLVLETDVNVTGSQLTIAPNSITNRHLVCSNSIGTPRTLTAATRTINAGADFQDITAAGATPWNLSAISVGDAGGNSGISFSTPATRTLAVTTGSVNWDATTTWSGATVPLAHDNVSISTGTSTLTISTNNRVYLGNVTFGSFAGVLVVSNVLPDHTIVTGNTFDLSNVTGSISTSRLTFISRSVATLFPGSVSVFDVAPSIISTLSLTMAGANDLNVASTGTLSISSLSFSTNTGSRICNISNSLGGITIGSSVGTYTSTYSTAVTSNIASSTIYAGGGIIIRDCVGTTPSISTSSGNKNIHFQDSVNFTNAAITPGANVLFDLGVSASNNITLGSSVITATNVSFSAGFTFNSASAIINVTQGVFQTSSSPATWVEGTTQINFTGVIANATLTFGFAGNLTASTVYRVTINDTASTLGATTEIFLDGSTSNPAIRFFDASAMRRPLRLGHHQLYGGLNAVFSNRAYTYLRTPSQYRIVGSDPLYIPYAFCDGANVVSGSIVAYGPANLGNNTGNITFPSRLRYYAFVDTATSMTVPNDYNGMGLLLAVGGGATPSSVPSLNAGRGGGGGGGTSYTFLLPPNNLTAPVVPGQTIYIRAGAYAVAPVANTAGGNGNTSWANVSSNVAPSTTIQGVLATGGGTSTTTSGGVGASTTSAVGHIKLAGGAGSASTSGGGGGGGGSSRFAAVTSVATNIASGGSGTISASINTGQGGSGSVAGGAPGTAGLSPTAGANGSASTGAGGGGGGGNTYNPTATTTTSNVTRANGSSTMIFNVTNHGFIAGDRILVTASPIALKTGTYLKVSSSSAAAVNVLINNHGLVAGNVFYFTRLSGSLIPSGTYTVATASTNSFTFVPNISGTSGIQNCSLGQAGLAINTTYSVTVVTANQFQVTGSVSTILYANQYSYTYLPVYVRAIYNAANGGSGALNSSENFIRYYNNAYTPGYFGVGAGGGGGGSIVNNAANYGNQGGNGGDGGIGSGGGGVGRSGNFVPGSISATAISGRGGPGLIMFIYALRANNQPLIQGQ